MTDSSSSAATSFQNKDWQYAKNFDTPISSNGEPDFIEESAGAIHVRDSKNINSTSKSSSLSSSELHSFHPFITTNMPTVGDATSFLVQHVEIPNDVVPSACPPQVLDSVLQQLRSLRAVPMKHLTLHNDEHFQSEPEISHILLRFRSLLPAEDQFINLSPSKMPIVNFAVVYGPTAKAEGAQKALNYLKKKQSEHETKCYLQVLIVSPDFKIVDTLNANNANNSSTADQQANRSSLSSSSTNPKPRSSGSSNSSNLYGSSKISCSIPGMPEASSNTFVHIPWQKPSFSSTTTVKKVETTNEVENNNNNNNNNNTNTNTNRHSPIFYSLPTSQQQAITKTCLQNFCISIATAAAGWACGRLRSLAETPNATFFATALDEAAFSMLQAATDKTGRLEMRTAKYKADLHLLLGRPLQALQLLNHPQLFDRNAARGPGDFLWICGASDTLCAIRWLCLRGVIMSAKRDSEWIFENRRCFIEDQPPEGFEDARANLQDIWGRWSKALRIDQVSGKSQAFPYLADWARGFQWSCMSFDGTMPVFDGTRGSTNNNGGSLFHQNGGGGKRNNSSSVSQQQDPDFSSQDPNNPLTSNLPSRHKRSLSQYSGGATNQGGGSLSAAQQQALRNQQALLQKEQCVPAREFDDFLTNLFSEFEDDLKANISTLQDVSSRVIFPGSDRIAAVMRLEAEAKLMHFMVIRCIAQPTSVYAPRVLLSSCRDFVRKYLAYAHSISRDLAVHYSPTETLTLLSQSTSSLSASTKPKVAAASPSYVACLLIGLEKFKATRYALGWFLRRAGLRRSAVEFLRDALINSSLNSNSNSLQNISDIGSTTPSLLSGNNPVIASTIHDPILVTELWSELLRWVGLNASSPLSSASSALATALHQRPGRAYMDTVLPDVENASPNRLSPITGDVARSFVEQAFAGIVFHNSNSDNNNKSVSSPNHHHGRTHSRSMSGQSKNFPPNFTAKQLAAQMKRQHVTAALNTMRIRASTLALLRINDSFFSDDNCVKFFQWFISSSGSGGSNNNSNNNNNQQQQLSLQSQQQNLMMQTSMNASPNGECGAGLTVTNVNAKPLAPHLTPQPFRFSGYMEGAFKDDFYFSKNSLTGKISQSGPVIWVVDEVCVISVEIHNSFVFPLQLDRVALHGSNANASSAVGMMSSTSSTNPNLSAAVRQNMTNNSGIAFDSTFLTIPPQQTIAVDLFFQPVVIGEAQIDGVVWTSSDLCGANDVEFFAPFPFPLITPVMEELPTATIKIDRDLSLIAPSYLSSSGDRNGDNNNENNSNTVQMTENGTQDDSQQQKKRNNNNINSSNNANQHQNKPTNSARKPNQLPSITVFQGQRVEIPILIVNTGTTPIPLSQEKLERTSKMWYSTMNAAAHEQHCQLRVCAGCASVVQILAPDVMGLRTLDAGESLPTTLVINPKEGWIVPAANSALTISSSGGDNNNDTGNSSGARQHGRTMSLGLGGAADLQTVTQPLQQQAKSSTHRGHSYSLSVVSPRAALHRYTQSLQTSSSYAAAQDALSKTFGGTAFRRPHQQLAQIFAPLFVPPQVNQAVISRVRLEVFASKEPPFAIAQSDINKLGSCPNVFCHLPARMQRLNFNVNILPSVRATAVTLSASKRIHVSMMNDNRDWAVEMKREVEVFSETGELLDVLVISGDILCGPGQTQPIIVPVSSSQRCANNRQQQQQDGTDTNNNNVAEGVFSSFSFSGNCCDEMANANNNGNKTPRSKSGLQQFGAASTSASALLMGNSFTSPTNNFDNNETPLSILKDAYSLVFRWQYLQCYEVFREGKTEVPLASIRHQITEGFSVADLNVAVSIFEEREINNSNSNSNKTGQNRGRVTAEPSLLSSNEDATSAASGSPVILHSDTVESIPLKTIKKWNPQSTDMVVESDETLTLDVLGNYRVQVVITAPKNWLKKVVSSSSNNNADGADNRNNNNRSNLSEANFDDEEASYILQDESTSFEIEFDVPGGAMIDGCTKGLLEFRNQLVSFLGGNNNNNNNNNNNSNVFKSSNLSTSALPPAVVTKNPTNNTGGADFDYVNIKSKNELFGGKKNLVVPPSSTNTTSPPEGKLVSSPTKVFKRSSDNNKPTSNNQASNFDDENSIVQINSEDDGTSSQKSKDEAAVEDDFGDDEVAPLNPSAINELRGGGNNRGTNHNNTNHRGHRQVFSEEARDPLGETLANTGDFPHHSGTDDDEDCENLSFNMLNDSDVNIQQQQTNNENDDVDDDDKKSDDIVGKRNDDHNNHRGGGDFRSAAASHEQTIMLSAKMDLDCVLFAVGTMKLRIHLRTSKDSKSFVVPLLVQVSHY